VFPREDAQFKENNKDEESQPNWRKLDLQTSPILEEIVGQILTAYLCFQTLHERLQGEKVKVQEISEVDT
jgi:hypothetical protein